MRSTDRKSTRLNSSHTVIYTLSLHDALPIFIYAVLTDRLDGLTARALKATSELGMQLDSFSDALNRSEEHTSELQSHSDLHSFPTRRSSDLHLRRLD